jgi:outer membrane protein OmpA-like peptidoglycan-associated protein
LVIDPLIDRATGQETSATRIIGRRMAELIAERHPQFEVKPFTESVMAENPFLLLGSMTPSKLGDTQPAAETADTYRIWAVLVDWERGMVLSHPTAWVKASDVDATPTEFYKQSPVWLSDALHAAYIRTCASAPDKPADPGYLQGVHAQSLVTQAIEAYESGDYRRSLALYEQARNQPEGVQLRVLNGIYLAKRALRDRRGEEAAFKELVDYGLEKSRLALKLLFRPGSATQPMEASAGPQYRMWLDALAERAGSREVCLLVAGHASRTGSAAFNDKLSHRRAEFAAQPPAKARAGIARQSADARLRLPPALGRHWHRRFSRCAGPEGGVLRAGLPRRNTNVVRAALNPVGLCELFASRTVWSGRHRTFY